MSTLRAHNLVKRYRQRQVVRGVSVNVDAGEVVGLLGPNGAGKTTCFYMIVGLVTADQGQIWLEDQDISAKPMHLRARRGLSYLAQEASVFRKLSAQDNLLAVLETRKDLTRDQRLNRCLDPVEPKIMLLDEPFAGVDPIAVGDIKQIVAHLRDRGIGVLITDHNVRETLDICDRAYIINEGQVIAEGAPQVLLEDAQVRSVYLGEHFRL